MSQHNHFLFVYLPSTATGLRQRGLIGNVVFFHLISNELNAGTLSFSRRHGTSCCSCVQPSGPPGSATPSPITSWKTMRWQQRSLRNSGKHNRLDTATVSHFLLTEPGDDFQLSVLLSPCRAAGLNFSLNFSDLSAKVRGHTF